MNAHRTILGASLLALVALAGCEDKKDGPEAASSAKPASTAAAAATGDTKEAKAEAPAPAGELDLSTPKKSIETQLKLLAEGKVDELKKCFTDRQKEKVTADAVAKGKGEVGKMTIDDLFAKTEDTQVDGKKAVKVRMKEGDITLTTLVEHDGKWLADTIWFK